MSVIAKTRDRGLHIGIGRVCVQFHCLPLASLHLEISVSVGTRPRFANSILASFRMADSSIRWRVSNLRRALSADIVNPKTADMVTRKTLRGNVCLLGGLSIKGEEGRRRYSHRRGS